MNPQVSIFSGNPLHQQAGMVGPIYPNTSGELTDKAKAFANKPVPMWQAGLAALLVGAGAYYYATNYHRAW
jgi:hypothetical protein